MKKVGSISAAMGFIFLGLWLLIRQSSPLVGEEFFKWWPIIIVILGIEVLVSFSGKSESQRFRLNGLIIPVILIFLFVNMFINAKVDLGEGFRWLKDSKNFNEVSDILKNIDDTNYKVIESNKILDYNGGDLTVKANNADIKILKSSDGKFKLSTRTYVKKDSGVDSYDIKEAVNSGVETLEFYENYIKKVQINLSIPENSKVSVKADNLKVTSDSDLPKASIIVDCNNIYADINTAALVQCKANNGKIDTSSANTVNINSNNVWVNIEGDSENINLDVDNGMITIDNNLSKNVNVQMSTGTIKMKTTDQNVKVDMELDHGTCTLNDERRVNAGIDKSFGNGEGKIKLKLDNGVISFSN